MAGLISASNLFAQPAPALRGFGIAENEERLPGFGSNIVRLPKVNSNDRANGANMLRRFDRNGSGDLSREELAQYRYSDFLKNLFVWDVDGDDRVTSEEMAYFYANARLAQLRKKAEAIRAKQQATEFKVTPPDVYNAKAQIKKFDRNKDRRLDKKEAAAAWGNNAAKIFAEYDLNKSGYLISNELARYYAKSRMGQQKNQSRQNPQLVALSHWRIQNSKLRHYVVTQNKARSSAAKIMIGRYDTNGNGMLERNEQQRIEGSVHGADSDNNGILTHEELSAWLQKQGTGPATTPSVSAPDWFTRRDANGDQQVSMSEYSSQWSDSTSAEFAMYDHDGDGFISLAESRVKQRQNTPRVEFVSRRGAVIEPGVGASLNISVNDDFEIADVDLRLSISHPAPAQLDAVLISPSGKRIKLFSGEGKKWEGTNMEDTVFDDEAEKSVSNATPPFRDAFKPEGVESKEKQGLSSLNGQRSAGRWRLVVYATRSPSAGLLNRCKLQFVPKSEARDTLTRTQ